MEFIRCDNKDSCDCSRTNGILGSSLEKNISLIEEKLGQSNIQILFILLIQSHSFSLDCCCVR